MRIVGHSTIECFLSGRKSWVRSWLSFAPRNHPSCSSVVRRSYPSWGSAVVGTEDSCGFGFEREVVGTTVVEGSCVFVGRTKGSCWLVDSLGFGGSLELGDSCWLGYIRLVGDTQCSSVWDSSVWGTEGTAGDIVGGTVASVVGDIEWGSSGFVVGDIAEGIGGSCSWPCQDRCAVGRDVGLGEGTRRRSWAFQSSTACPVCTSGCSGCSRRVVHRCRREEVGWLCPSCCPGHCPGRHSDQTAS